jgi:hypothetical protein
MATYKVSAQALALLKKKGQSPCDPLAIVAASKVDRGESQDFYIGFTSALVMAIELLGVTDPKVAATALGAVATRSATLIDE